MSRRYIGMSELLCNCSVIDGIRFDKDACNGLTELVRGVILDPQITTDDRQLSSDSPRLNSVAVHSAE